MDCMQIKEKLVQYIEGLLTEEEKTAIDNHLDECNECRKELDALMEIREKLILSNRQNQSADLENRVFNSIVCEQNRRLKQKARSNPWFENWRSMMKGRTARLSAATAMVFAVIIGITVFNKYEPVATAQDVLTDALKASSDINSVHMKARMRTLPDDNFGLIGLDYDFVPIEMWKDTNQKGKIKWRVEKTSRILVMNGDTTTMLIKPNTVSRSDKALPLGCYDSWMGCLLDVQGLLDSELQQAKDNSDQQARLIHEEQNGKDKLILEVDVQASVSKNDYLRDKFITRSKSLSDLLKVYQFDSQTKLLEDFKIYVIDEGQEVLVFEVTDIEYNADIDDSVFVLDLPDDAIWWLEPQILPDNEKYSRMTPKETAAALCDAAYKGDWDEVLKFVPISEIPQELKDLLFGMELISLGEPFQSENDTFHWFVPYKIKFRNGEIKEWNLALRNDNQAQRYVFDGGF